MRSIQNLRAAVRAIQPRAVAQLSQHRAITRLSLASLALAVALGVSLQNASAGQTPASIRAPSLLAENVGIGVVTTRPIVLTFDEPMDRASVAEHLSLAPATATRLLWSEDGRSLTLVPTSRWETDARYAISVAAGAIRADGELLGSVRSVSFTTQTAPTISNFQVHLLSSHRTLAGPSALAGGVPVAAADFTLLGDSPLIDAPEDTLDDASSETGVRITFAGEMNRRDVERRFTILPHVKGSMSWRGSQLVFSPQSRLRANTRYAVSVAGAHDVQGNRIAGDVSFSFTTRVGAKLMRLLPSRHAENVMAKQVALRFSQPMKRRLTADALRVTDLGSGRHLGGAARWNANGTLLQFRFHEALPRGSLIEVSLAKAARDLAGNSVTVSWTFHTKPLPAAEAQPTAQPTGPTPVTGPAAPADLQEYALWLINQSRAQYGFAPLHLDAAVAAVASAHAWDQVNYGYFSHTGRDGSRVSDRLRRAGIGFSWSGENMCYYNGLGVRAMLDWCHSTFMSEPYPGFANHIGNVLGAHYTRVGVGIAQSGGKVIIVWDFAN